MSVLCCNKQVHRLCFLASAWIVMKRSLVILQGCAVRLGDECLQPLECAVYVVIPLEILIFLW